MASLGQPEMDLGWFLYFDRQFTEPRWGCPARQASDRTRTRSSATASLPGRPMKDVYFYEVFSGIRFAAIMYRLSDLVFGRQRGWTRRPTWRPTTWPPSSWPRCSTWIRQSESFRRGGPGRRPTTTSPGGPTATPAARRRSPSHCALVGLLPHVLLPAGEDPVRLLPLVGNVGDDVHRHLLVVTGAQPRRACPRTGPRSRAVKALAGRRARPCPPRS